MDNFDLRKYISEGRLLKEDMSLEVDGDFTGDYEVDKYTTITLSGDSGDYDGFLNDDGTISFSLVDDNIEDKYEEGFEDENWFYYLGPKHTLVQISKKIPTKVETGGDYVMITVDLEDLKNLFKIN